MTQETPTGGYLDPRDEAYAATLDGAERDTVVATVTRFRREDKLHVGDAIPTLELLRLESGSSVALETLVGERPLVLVFGSFT
jgi:hypothetical protein